VQDVQGILAIPAELEFGSLGMGTSSSLPILLGPDLWYLAEGQMSLSWVAFDKHLLPEIREGRPWGRSGFLKLGAVATSIFSTVMAICWLNKFVILFCSLTTFR